jgi:hypothetical protein
MTFETQPNNPHLNICLLPSANQCVLPSVDECTGARAGDGDGISTTCCAMHCSAGELSRFSGTPAPARNTALSTLQNHQSEGPKLQRGRETHSGETNQGGWEIKGEKAPHEEGTEWENPRRTLQGNNHCPPGPASGPEKKSLPK